MPQQRILSVVRAEKTFVRQGARLQALRGMSFDICEKETLGLVGESGSGKSTVARSIVGLENIDSGSIEVMGTNVVSFSHTEWLRYRRLVQYIFQDSFSSMNPRMTVQSTLVEPLRLLGGMSRAEADQIVRSRLMEVGLDHTFLRRRRNEMSGGQLQRVNIARALVVNPRLVILDEPVSALDASVRGVVLDLLRRLKERHGLSYLYISHDLATVRGVCDRVAIAYRGQIVETGPVGAVFSGASHPYTRDLLQSMLSVDPEERSQQVSEDWTNDECWSEDPENGRFPTLIEVEPDHYVARRGTPHDWAPKA